MQATKKRLALSIIDFLNTSLKDGTLPPDDKESIEVATSCIADSFKVDPTDLPPSSSVPTQNLLSIYSVYEKLRETTANAASGANAGSPGPASPRVSTGPNPEAESLKGQGNAAMQSKDYDAAIEFYTKAIELVPTNAIYLSNRAAAYSAQQKHELAKQDAELAVASNPAYTKAWSRLGLARFALGDAKGSMEAYQSGIDAEGSGGSPAMKKGYETAKRRVEELAADDVTTSRSTAQGSGSAGGMPDLSGLASMLGGGGAGGGMPDLSAIMNNPMMRQMAQSVMQNPDMLNNIMNNPMLRDMAGQFGAGGGQGGSQGGRGTPDLSSLMQDPAIAEMARSFMGGAGGTGGAAGAGAGGTGRQ